jgi:Bacterial alpha-L-rhamnosidase 6 hairpin glycosidase domain/Bacterial alpha-L-rhamnosidase C-terminal domain
MTGQDIAAPKYWCLGICLTFILIWLILPLNGVASKTQPGQGFAVSSTGQPNPWSATAFQSVLQVFLPVVEGDRIPAAGKGVPIWSHSNKPASHEVNLFRHTFTLTESLLNSNLQIFADTRYEVWVDGVWIGRGPARFSTHTHEYDIYNLGTLERGNHLVAVWVQWAPNNRRSESTTPHLVTHIEGKSSGRKVFAAGTGPEWKSINSDAWARNAVPVHAWGLIGPTELLDYRRLPANWMGPAFNDEDWPPAVEKDLSQVDYHPLIVPRLTSLDSENLLSSAFKVLDIDRVDPGLISIRPRTLPMLVKVPVKATVLDAGRLSAGRRIGELSHDKETQEVDFSSNATVKPAIEVLSTSGMPDAGQILIDGNPIQWNSPTPNRPDVYTGEISLGIGAHRISFQDVPQDGLTFALEDQGISFSSFPFEQGLHAGRRLLLSEPFSDANAVEVSKSKNNLLNLQLVNLPAFAVLDLGRTIHGRLSAEVSGPSGSIVDIGWDERLLPDSLRTLPYPGSLHPQWNQVDSWVLDGHPRRLGTIDARAGRYVLIAAWGKGPIVINNLEIYEERLPLQPVGDFSSPDDVLNAVWKIGTDTLYANMTDAYADPWRERGQWWGDAFVVDHANQAAFGDSAILRRGIDFMAEAITDGRPNAMAPNGSGQHMLDYGMLWVQSVKDYVERTGDTSVLDQIYPRLMEFLAYLSTYESSSTGLLDIPVGTWMETTYIDTIGQSSRYGQSTAVNALYYGTLVDASELAGLAGYPTDATKFKNKAASIKQTVNTYLFRPQQHRYLSSIQDGKTIPPTAHAQAWSLAYDLVPADEVKPVAGSLLELISMQPLTPDVEIYGTFWVLEALGRAGMIHEGIDLIKVYYGHLLDAGARTTWEIYNSDQKYTQSLSHGWGSSPTWFLTTYLLGARQTGMNYWEVQPAFESEQQASGRLPLPKGVLDISWVTNASGDLTVTIDAPADSSGKVILPQISGATISVDGKIVWSNNSSLSEDVVLSDKLILITLTDGLHRITLLNTSE